MWECLVTRDFKETVQSEEEEEEEE